VGPVVKPSLLLALLLSQEKREGSMTVEMAPFFTDRDGKKQNTLYHSHLTPHRNLIVKFKQKPFQSQYPRANTPGKVVYLELDDGNDYLYTIESDAIVTAIEEHETDQWVKVTASGSGDEAVLEIYPMAPFELADEGLPQPTEPSEPVKSPPAGNQPTPTHVDSVAMTLEVVNAFEGTSVVLDAGAVSRIYNTHFIQLSKQRGGLVR
jgi:hypothetical protein